MTYKENHRNPPSQEKSNFSGAEPENEPMNNPKSLVSDNWLKGIDGTNKYQENHYNPGPTSNHTGSLSATAKRLYHNESITNYNQTQTSKLSPSHAHKFGLGHDVPSEDQSFQSFVEPGSMMNSQIGPQDLS